MATESEARTIRTDVTVSVDRGTHERLRAHGGMGESFDTVINRLLDFAEASRDAYHLFKENRQAER